MATEVLKPIGLVLLMTLALAIATATTAKAGAKGQSHGISSVSGMDLGSGR